MVLEDGELRWPPPPGVIPAANTKTTVEKETKKETGPVDLYEPTKKNAIATSAAIAGRSEEWCSPDDMAAVATPKLVFLGGGKGAFH